LLKRGYGASPRLSNSYQELLNVILTFVRYNGLTLTIHELGRSTFSPNTFAKLLNSNKVFVSRVFGIGDVQGVFQSDALNRASTNFSRRPGALKAGPLNATSSLPRSITGKRSAVGHLSRMEITDSMWAGANELTPRRGGAAVRSPRSAKTSVSAELSSGYAARFEVD
jgi:hypothetical protein